MLLSLGCALIDPIDAFPNGAASSASGGASSASGAFGGLSASSDQGGAAPSAAGFASTVKCMQNADCEPNSRCLPNGVCVRLNTEETGPCPKLLGGEFAHDPKAIFFGAFAPLDQSSVEARTISAIYEMAATELNSLGGLRSNSGEGPSPLVVIVCNNSEENTPKALAHLIGDVHVPAVLAAMDPGQLLAGFNAYPHTFFVSAFSSSQELASVSDGRAWTMSGRPADYADIYQALMPHAEALVHADLTSAGKDREIRVASVIETGSAFERELSDAVIRGLTFNGSSAGAQATTNYRGYEVDSAGANLERVVADIYEQLPDIVLSFAGGVFTAGNGGVMTALNQNYWEGQRPVFILSPENAEAGTEVGDQLTNLRKVDHKYNVGRVLGVGPAGLPSGASGALTEFWTHILLKYPDARTDFGNYYDAFYFLVDAIYASPRKAFFNGTINASDLTRGMFRLTNLGKTRFDIGPNDLSDVFSVLEAPNSEIELDGTMGTPDFDRVTGMRRESGSIYCFDSTRVTIQKDVIRYDRDTKQLEQVAHPLCLINFLNQ